MTSRILRLRFPALSAKLLFAALPMAGGLLYGFAFHQDSILAAGNAPGGASGAIDVCTLLPDKTVSAITKRRVVGASAGGIRYHNGYRSTCTYGERFNVAITVVRPDGVDEFSRAQTRGGKPIFGLGDKAFYDSPVGVGALFGDTLILAHVEKEGGDTAQSLSEIDQALVKAIHDKL